MQFVCLHKWTVRFIPKILTFLPFTCFLCIKININSHLNANINQFNAWLLKYAANDGWKLQETGSFFKKKHMITIQIGNKRWRTWEQTKTGSQTSQTLRCSLRRHVVSKIMRIMSYCITFIVIWGCYEYNLSRMGQLWNKKSSFHVLN